MFHATDRSQDKHRWRREETRRGRAGLRGGRFVCGKLENNSKPLKKITLLKEAGWRDAGGEPPTWTHARVFPLELHANRQRTAKERLALRRCLRSLWGWPLTLGRFTTHYIKGLGVWVGEMVDGGEQLGGRGEEIRLSSAAQREKERVCVLGEHRRQIPGCYNRMDKISAIMYLCSIPTHPRKKEYCSFKSGLHKQLKQNGKHKDCRSV